MDLTPLKSRVLGYQQDKQTTDKYLWFIKTIGIIKITGRETTMNGSIRMVGIYLLVFLLGWSCAVLSYSDVIYSQHNGSIKADVIKKEATKSKL